MNFVKTPAQKLVVLVVFLSRILSAFLILSHPIAGIVLSYFFDALDHTLFLIVGMRVDLKAGNLVYQLYDKIFDQYYYVFILIFALQHFPEPFRAIATILFFYRVIGLVLFLIFRKSSLWLIFQNFFENFAIAVLLFNDHFQADPLVKVITFLAMAIITKAPQEYILYKRHTEFSAGPAVRQANFVRRLFGKGKLTT